MTHILDFIGHKVCVTALQLGHCSRKAAIQMHTRAYECLGPCSKETFIMDTET